MNTYKTKQKKNSKKKTNKTTKEIVIYSVGRRERESTQIKRIDCMLMCVQVLLQYLSGRHSKTIDVKGTTTTTTTTTPMNVTHILG